MPHIITADNGILTRDMNGLVSGGQVVVLDRIPSVKEPSYSGSGVPKETANRIALPASKEALQGSFLHTGINSGKVQPMFPSSGSGSGSSSGLVSNHLKIPTSLKKKEKKRNNIKLVL